MANELVHASVGTALSQAEWEDVNTHIVNNSTQGTVLYISSSGAIMGLAPATTGQLLQTNGTGAAPSWGPMIDYGQVATSTSGVVVNFAKPFTAVPRVTLGTVNNSNAVWHGIATTTGFLAYANVGGGIVVDWIAIGT